MQITLERRWFVISSIIRAFILSKSNERNGFCDFRTLGIVKPTWRRNWAVSDLVTIHMWFQPRQLQVSSCRWFRSTSCYNNKQISRLLYSFYLARYGFPVIVQKQSLFFPVFVLHVYLLTVCGVRQLNFHFGRLAESKKALWIKSGITTVKQMNKSRCKFRFSLWATYHFESGILQTYWWYPRWLSSS